MHTYELSFSPTGGTKKVSSFIAEQFSKEFIQIDLSNNKTNFNDIVLNSEDTAIIAVPSYSGRVPVIAVDRILKIKGNGAKAVIVCVYGNRAYEDTLIELKDIVQKAGCIVVGAIASIAEHSISHKYAVNRPDQNDYNILKTFACKISEKINKNNFTTPVIPGSIPYRKFTRAGIVPKATKNCTKCGICASNCPVGAINHSNPLKTNNKKCISCMRCVSICHNNARKVNKLLIGIVNIMLKKVCSVRKECELYL